MVVGVHMNDDPDSIWLWLYQLRITSLSKASSPPRLLDPPCITAQVAETSRLATSWESTWTQVHGTRYSVPSTWYCTWYHCPSTWYQYRVLGTEYKIRDAWYQVIGTMQIGQAVRCVTASRRNKPTRHTSLAGLNHGGMLTCLSR